MTFLALGTWQALLLAGLTAAVVTWLFFLKLRHPRILVGSLLLWERVLEERRPESWLERLRRLISLLIALTIALLVALALGRPLIEVLTGERREIVIVLDTSPTLATVTADGRTRWAHAQDRARALVEASRPGDRLSVVDTSGTVVSAPTTNRREALEAIDRMAPSTASPRLPNLPTRETELFVISDGVAIPSVPPGAERVSVFEPADNVAVTAFEIRPVPADPQLYEAYLEVTNFSPRTKQVEVSVGSPDQPQLHRSTELEAGQILRQSLEMSSFDGGEVRASVQAPGDALAVDDVAYAYLPDRRPLKITLVTSGNAYLETLLALEPRVEVERVSPSGFRDGAPADAYVFDRYAPATPPQAPALFFRPPEVSWLGTSLGELDNPAPSSWDDSHPTMRFVPVTDLRVDTAEHLDLESATAVAMAGDAPLISVRDHPEKQVVVAFDLEDSDFAGALAFPIFMHNVLSWFAQEQPVLRHAPGPVAVPLADGRIVRSNGDVVPAQAQLGGTVFHASDPGVFMAITDDARIPVVVNVASHEISDVNRSSFAAVTDAAVPRPTIFRHEPWFYMLLLALLLLGAEWWTYHRRITV